MPPGASWGILGHLRWLLACLTPSEAVLRASLGRLRALLERFRALLGPSWEPLERSWGPLGLIRGLLGSLTGRLGAILEASWAVLGDRKPKQAMASKSIKHLGIIIVFCRQGRLGGLSRAS